MKSDDVYSFFYFLSKNFVKETRITRDTDSVNVSVPVLTAKYLLFLGELLDLWMTVKRSFPEIPVSLDAAFLYHIVPLIIFILLLDSCFVVVMKIISPIFPLCSQKNWAGVTI